MKEIYKAFLSPAFPSNPLPFLSELIAGVKEHGTDWIKSNAARTQLHVLNSMCYGQMYEIDSYDEFTKLKQMIESIERVSQKQDDNGEGKYHE